MTESTEDSLKKLLSGICLDFSLLSAAVLNLDEEKKISIRAELSRLYSNGSPAIGSEYILRTLGRRSNPFTERPWAKSYMCMAVPLEIIAKLELDIPRTDTAALSAASYAGHLDYHIFCAKLMERCLERFAEELKINFKSEICVDTKPVPEKILAKFAKLGKTAYNNCLICNGRTDFFIASSFLELNLPSLSLSDDFGFNCESCKICLRNCPGGALEKNKFSHEKCISHITMEKKGELSTKEKKIIGAQIFGCDICTSSCPNSSTKQPLKINKEWLLSLSQKKFKKIFEKSPLLYASLKKIKRNAGK